MTSPPSSLPCDRWGGRSRPTTWWSARARWASRSPTRWSASPTPQSSIVDRNDQPGGHWTTAYPFVRLHQPSAYYGVNSRQSRQRHHRPWRPERGLLRIGQRRRGVRVLRRGDAAAPAAHRPGHVSADERIPRRRPDPDAGRRRDRGDGASRRHQPRGDRRAVDAPTAVRRRRRRLRAAQRACRGSATRRTAT